MKVFKLVSKGGYKRRSTYGMIPVSFEYIRNLVKKVDQTRYDSTLKLRNKALIVLLYYSARRISELVGRKLILNDDSIDEWPGVCVEDFRFDKREGRDTIIMNVRILKKGRAKKESIKRVFREVVMYCDWPLMEIFIEWYKHQIYTLGPDTKIFNLSRSRAYQILKELDPRIIGNHWLRHQRLSHMAEFLTPFQLNERLGFWERLDPAISYVHGRIGKYLEAGDKVVA